METDQNKNSYRDSHNWGERSTPDREDRSNKRPTTEKPLIRITQRIYTFLDTLQNIELNRKLSYEFKVFEEYIKHPV